MAEGSEDAVEETDFFGVVDDPAQDRRQITVLNGIIKRTHAPDRSLSTFRDLVGRPHPPRLRRLEGHSCQGKPNAAAGSFLTLGREPDARRHFVSSPSEPGPRRTARAG